MFKQVALFMQKAKQLDIKIQVDRRVIYYLNRAIHSFT